MLYEKLDPYESERGVPVAKIIKEMIENPLLQSLLDQPESGADLMHTRMPRSVRAALTQWSLSSDNHISWKQLLALFMDPHTAISNNPNDGELTGTLSMVTSAVRRSVGLGGQSPRNSRSPGSTRSAASRHRSALRKSRASASSSSSEGEEEEEEGNDPRRPSAYRTPGKASGEAAGEMRLSPLRPSASMGARASKVAFAADNAASKVVELTVTPLGLGLRVDSQYTVLEVTPGSQAARSGSFAVNDRLVSLNGQALGGGASGLEQQLRAMAVGSKVAVEVRKAPSGAAPSGAAPSGASPAPPRATSMDARLSKAKGKQPVP